MNHYNHANKSEPSQIKRIAGKDSKLSLDIEETGTVDSGNPLIIIPPIIKPIDSNTTLQPKEGNALRPLLT